MFMGHGTHGGCQEGDSLALAAGPSRAANAVGVLLDLGGHVVVDDQRNVRHVDAAPGNVSGNQNIVLLLPEPCQAGFSLVLQTQGTENEMPIRYPV